jgi:hypothetical protein
MLIGSGLQALATPGKFKPVDFGQIRTAGDTWRALLWFTDLSRLNMITRGAMPDLVSIPRQSRGL